MKFLVFIILVAGGGYYYTQHYQKDANSGSSGGSTDTSSILKEGGVNETRYKGLSKPDLVTQSVKDAKALQYNLNSILENLDDNTGTKTKSEVDRFVKNYIKILGKAYTAAKGQDKTALKAIKLFVVGWYQREAYNHEQIMKNINILKWSTKGNLTDSQSSNRYALTELAKLTKQDSTYLSSFRNNIRSSRSKYSISNSEIRSYFDELVSSMDSLAVSGTSLNKSLSKLIDKVYAYNSWVLRNFSSGNGTINRGKWEALIRIVDEIKVAKTEFDREWAQYKAAYH